MRHFQKLIAPAVLLSAALVTALPASAEVIGCFGRSYSPEHMAANPAQRVREIRAKVQKAATGDAAMPYHSIDIRVHFRDDAREFVAWAGCYPDNGVVKCGMDCDAGTITPEFGKDGRLRLTTSLLNAEFISPNPGGGCDDLVTRDITDGTGEKGQLTVFLLQPRVMAECNWNDPW